MKMILATALLLALSSTVWAAHDGSATAGAVQGMSQTASGSGTSAYAGVQGNGIAFNQSFNTTRGEAYSGGTVDRFGTLAISGGTTTATSGSQGFQAGGGRSFGSGYGGSAIHAQAVGAFGAFGTYHYGQSNGHEGGGD